MKIMFLNMCLKILLVLLSLIYNVSSYYDIFYMEDYCKPGHTLPAYDISVGSSGSNSSGILRATQSLFYSSGLNCSVNLQVPPIRGVVVSLRYMELRRNFQCQDYLQLISGTSTFIECGPRHDDISESRSFRFFNNVTIRFHTSSSLLGLASGFQLTFTSVKDSTKDGTCNDTEFQCNNRLCIWGGLTCDHHNNCGDKSDERSASPSHCGFPRYRFSLRGFLLSLLSVLIVVSLLTYICRRYRQRGTYVGTVLSSAPPPSGSAHYGNPAMYGTYGYPPNLVQQPYPMPPPPQPIYMPAGDMATPPPPYSQKPVP